MVKNKVDFFNELLKKIAGTSRKTKTFNGRVYVSLGGNKVAILNMGMPSVKKNYGYGCIDINILDKNCGRIDSMIVDFEAICLGTELRSSSRDYFVDCNGTGWYTEPPKEFFDLLHNEVESYLEIFEEDF